jgi:hypothetical protein
VTAIVRRPTSLGRVHENRQRLVALEQVVRLGMGVELFVETATFEGSTDTIDNWTERNDPHGFYQAGSSPTRIFVPEGLTGIYQISYSWRLESL